MKRILICALWLILSSRIILAVPSSFFGNGFFFPVIPAHPRFHSNLTRDVLTVANWEKNAFPGPWEEEPGPSDHEARRMTAMPVLFGAVPDSVYAYSEKGHLKEVAITYLDAGTFFGFKFGGEKNHAEREAGANLRSEFNHHFRELTSNLRSRLDEGCGAGEQKIVGRSTMLRTTFTDNLWEGFVLRVATRDGHSVAWHIMREEDATMSFVDLALTSLRASERRNLFDANVRRNERGDVLVAGIPMFTQNSTPYCGVHSLAMVGHYFGLRLRPNALAAYAEFRNTGSARGSQILDLYHATAEELAMRVQVSSKFDMDRARKSIEAGLPVIVWRRVSEERERAHNRFLASLATNPDAALTVPTPTQKSSWPERDKKGSPSHASVVSGFNDAHREVIFSEPWGEHARERHMRMEEMEATAYAVFYFQF